MDIPVPWDAKRGDLIECENCAGVLLRLRRKGSRDFLHLVHLVSCPSCGERVPVDDGTPEGSVIRHGGADFALVKEFGAFSLEPVGDERPGCASPRRSG